MISNNKNQKRINSSRGYEEARKAYRLTNIGNTYGKGNKGKLGKNKGIKRPEHSILMSGVNNPFYNKTHTEEFKQKQSMIMKERLKNNNINCKLVLDQSTGIFYNSAKEAAKNLNISYGTLKHYLNGTVKNKTNLIYV